MRNVKKRKLIAGVISAILAFSGYTIVDAYTYSGVTSTVDKVAEDENEFVVTGGSKITINGNTNPQKIKITNQTIRDVISVPEKTYMFAGWYEFDMSDLTIKNLPDNIPNAVANEIINAFKAKGEEESGNAELTSINTKYGLNIKLSWSCGEGGGMLDALYNLNDLLDFVNLKYENGKWIAEEFGEAVTDDKGNVISISGSYSTGQGSSAGHFLTSTSNVNFNNGEKVIQNVKNLGETSITVTNSSSLIGKGNVQTSKSINVNGTSTLSAVGTITGGTITSDGDIVAASNYSAPSGKSTITAPTINATGALTALKDISATTGSVSANTIQATSGNITASDTITAGGNVKANSINAAGVNASSATITGNQSIGGVFTATGQANLNGGAALNNKKITGLADGTLSASSTDAVNGRQLYNAMRNAGKTYTAGGDIVISSANAISVSKAGQIASGNTGIVTGGTVYTVTSALSNTLTDQGKQLIATTTSIKTINTAVENVRKSLSDLNTSNANFLSTWNSNSKSYVNKDLSNLSADGTASLKAMIKTEVQNQIASTAKTTASTSASTTTLENRQNDPIVATADTATADTSYIDNAVAGKADKSDLASLSKVVDTRANKTDLDSLTEKVNTKADLSYVNNELAKKADKATVDALSKDVKTNTENIAANSEAIKANTTDIAALKESKANVDASNIDVKAWGEKLGAGLIEKDNKGLVTGGVVFDALDKKADIGYVNAGFSMMEGQMQAMNQSLTRDINRVGAGAAALAGLHPQDYEPNNKLDFAVGYGHYKNANATALGLYYRPNAGTTFSLAGTIGNGDPMLSAGLSFKLGMGKNVEKVVVTKDDYDNMQAEMQAQDEKLQQMEAILQQLIR